MTRCVRAILFSPEAPSSELRPGYFQIHGGGFMMGAPEMADERNQAI